MAFLPITIESLLFDLVLLCFSWIPFKDLSTQAGVLSSIFNALSQDA